MDDGRIAWIGPERELEAAVDVEGARVVDARGGLVTPGLVDSHTHLVFAGEPGRRVRAPLRRQELPRRRALRRRHRGDHARATRAASDAALLADGHGPRARLLAQGVTTVEVKSGYGLSTADELRLLRVIRSSPTCSGREVTIVPTLLAHAVPPERGGDRDAVVRELGEVLLPGRAREARERVRRVRGGGRVHPRRGAPDPRRRRAPRPRAAPARRPAHASGGAQLAAELSCASADHLEHMDDEGIAALARAEVVAGLLPLSTLFLGSNRYAPARKLLSAGVRSRSRRT